MTKKDYIIIAKCFNNIYAPLYEQFVTHANHEDETNEASYKIWALQQLFGELATAFGQENPKFSWAKFKQMCYKK